MPWQSVRLNPGLDVEETATYSQAAYASTQFGRFKSGLFQKLGGWSKFYPLAVGGVGKDLHAWQDLNENRRLAVGTTTELDSILSGTLTTITPQSLDSDFNPDFATTASSATVTITDANIDTVTTDDAVYFRTPVAIGGLVLSGLYPIASRVSAHVYTITARSNAVTTRANLTITNITQANPGVVTYSGADNIANGDLVYIYGVAGMTQVNGGIYTVASLNTAANTFQLSGVDTTGFTAYTSGGTISFAAVPKFTTTSGSAAVSVTLQDHGQVAGNSVIFPISTSVGGVTIDGKYLVVSTSGADAFSITANAVASSSTSAFMNSGQAGLTYYIALGPLGSGTGYGLGDYGEGPYGIGGTGSSIQTGTPITVTDWMLDNWGEILIAGAENGPIYQWGPNSGFQNAGIITQAPIFNTGVFVSMAQQQLIAFGSSINAYEDANGGIGVYQDPLLVQWSDIGDFTNWTVNATTSAGNFRIPTGSAILGAMAVQNQNLIWTDLDLWSMAYTGTVFVYAFNKIGGNCGLIGKHARAQLGNSVYWMGRSNFFYYSGGGIQPIPCSVYDAVFQDLDLTNAHKTVAGSNTDFTEVWFFYPSTSGGLGYPDKYAKLNLLENTWEIGPLDRFAWIDRSILGSPIAIAATGLIYSHESGYDNDVLPMTPSFTTGYFYLSEGEDFTFIDKVFPDFKWGTYAGSENAQIQITVNAVENPGDTPTTYGPFTVMKTSPSIDCRIRARQISLTVASADSGSFWRLGLVRFRYSISGRR
jgi:Ubiquitin-activating enzyme E1 FCCH domain